MTQQNNKSVVVRMDARKLKREPDTNFPSISKAKLEKLIEEAVVDAYGEEEQVGGFLPTSPFPPPSSSMWGDGNFHVLCVLDPSASASLRRRINLRKKPCTALCK
jgi:hypothetical protein